MRVLIASDLHGSLDSLAFLNAKVKELRPDLLLLLGDLLYHGPRNPLPPAYDTMKMVDGLPDLLNLATPILAVRGNCDGEVDLGLVPFPLPEEAWLELDGLRVFASHGHKLPDRPPMRRFKPGMVFLRGHTHIPRAETVEGYHFWNPGSISLPKGDSPRSYGFYENGTFTVFDLNDKPLLSHTPTHQ